MSTISCTIEGVQGEGLTALDALVGCLLDLAGDRTNDEMMPAFQAGRAWAEAHDLDWADVATELRRVARDADCAALTPPRDEDEMPETPAACAHSTVRHQPKDHPNGTKSDAWVCADCGAAFWPAGPRADALNGSRQPAGYTEELRIPLANGLCICTAGFEREAGAYVRVVAQDGTEVGYWDRAEWADDPELVMGAFLRTCAFDAHALDSVEAVRLLQELYYCTSVLARGVGRIATPDGFFGRWNDAGAATERLAARLGITLERDFHPTPGASPRLHE